MIDNITDYESQLLAGWEEIYKRGQLTLWILIALSEGPKHMSAVKKYIKIHTDNMLAADDQSMYRALRRYTETELVTFKSEQTSSGPDRKIYMLTATGTNVLKNFTKRNIAPLVNDSMIQKIIGEEL